LAGSAATPARHKARPGSDKVAPGNDGRALRALDRPGRGPVETAPYPTSVKARAASVYPAFAQKPGKGPPVARVSLAIPGNRAMLLHVTQVRP